MPFIAKPYMIRSFLSLGAHCKWFPSSSIRCVVAWTLRTSQVCSQPADLPVRCALIPTGWLLLVINVSASGTSERLPLTMWSKSNLVTRCFMEGSLSLSSSIYYLIFFLFICYFSFSSQQNIRYLKQEPVFVTNCYIAGVHSIGRTRHPLHVNK